MTARRSRSRRTSSPGHRPIPRPPETTGLAEERRSAMRPVEHRRFGVGPLVWICLAIVYVVWGSTYLGIRVVVETMPPLLAGGVRFLLAGGIFWTVLRIRGGAARVRLSRSE